MLDDFGGGIEVESDGENSRMDSYATHSLDRGMTNRDQESNPLTPSVQKNKSTKHGSKMEEGGFSVGRMDTEAKAGLATLRNCMPAGGPKGSKDGPMDKIRRRGTKHL